MPDEVSLDAHAAPHRWPGAADRMSEAQVRALVPSGLSPPQGHETNRFWFRPLTVDRLGMDWLALNTAIDRVREQEVSIPGFEGLESPISVSDDFYDVAWHEREFELGSSLTYAVMAPGESRCLGSVYMYPAVGEAEADTEIYMWLTEDEYQRTGDEELYGAVKDWIAADFSFLGKVAYPGRDGSRRTVDFENWALVPSDFEVPERLEHERFSLVPLDVSLVLGDFESWMSNVEHVRRYEIRLPAEPTSAWPTYELSPLSNLVDMGWHFKEFQRRGSFAYAIVSPADERHVLGSVYVFPSDAEDSEATVPIWVRKREHEEGLDEVVSDAVRAWLELEWPFESVDYPRGNVLMGETR